MPSEELMKLMQLRAKCACTDCSQAPLASNNFRASLFERPRRPVAPQMRSPNSRLQVEVGGRRSEAARFLGMRRGLRRGGGGGTRAYLRVVVAGVPRESPARAPRGPVEHLLARAVFCAPHGYRSPNVHSYTAQHTMGSDRANSTLFRIIIFINSCTLCEYVLFIYSY